MKNAQKKPIPSLPNLWMKLTSNAIFTAFLYTHSNMKKEKGLTICRPEKKRSILDTTLERGRLGTKYTTDTIDVMVIFSSDIVNEICFTEVRNND